MSETSGLREFLRSPGGKAVVVIVVIAAFASMGWSIWSNLAPSNEMATLENPLFISASTGESFHEKLVIGMPIPVKSPNGKVDGYPAELCYWTKDGKEKKDPTPVLLNEVIGKRGPTFCPDCGRLVIHHNPEPGPGVRPPPTKEQFLGSR